MFDTAIEQILLGLFLSSVVVGVLYFIFYPAIVNYRKCRSNNGNIVTLTIINIPVVKNNSDKESCQVVKVENELDKDFKVKDVANSASTTIPKASATDVVNVPPILSIVIPAYDEEQRLPTMLLAAYKYLNDESCPSIQNLVSVLPLSISYPNNPPPLSNINDGKFHAIEWVVINDGSKDQTSLAYEKFIQQQTVVQPVSSSTTKTDRIRIHHVWKLVSFSKNCGKGAAVQAGMMTATGQFRLMVDADGATDFGPGLQLLTQRLKGEITMMPSPPDNTETIKHPIVFGSRAHLHQSSSNSLDDSQPQQQQQKRSVIRSFLMQSFHVFVLILVGTGRGNGRPPIVDTQCGFKLFPAYTAQRLFAILHLQRWAFDIELVYIIQSLLHYDCIEEVVPWKEIDGSKLNTSPYNLAMVAICMLRDMICVRLCYTLGIWNIKTTTIPLEQQKQTVKKNR